MIDLTIELYMVERRAYVGFKLEPGPQENQVLLSWGGIAYAPDAPEPERELDESERIGGLAALRARLREPAPFGADDCDTWN